MIFKIFSVIKAFSDRSSSWSKVRSKHLQKENFCQCCGKKRELEVHHITTYNVDETIELDENNLITLCSKCHLLFGHLMDYRSWNTQVVSDCAEMRRKIEHRPYISK